MSLPKYVEGAGDLQGFWSFQRQWIPGWKSEVNDSWVFTYEHETFALSVLQLPPTLAHLFASWLAIKLELVFCGKEKKKDYCCLTTSVVTWERFNQPWLFCQSWTERLLCLSPEDCTSSCVTAASKLHSQTTDFNYDLGTFYTHAVYFYAFWRTN